MIILGIDPGTRKVGLAIIHSRLASAGVLTVKPRILYHDTYVIPEAFLEVRLANWRDHLVKILDQWDPAMLAVENPLVARNIQVVDKLARVVGVTVAEAAGRKILVAEYRPQEHRKRSTGSGKKASNPSRYCQALRARYLNMPSCRKIDDHQMDALSLCYAAAVHVESGREKAG